MFHLKQVVDSTDDGIVAFDIMSGSQCVGFLEVDREHADTVKKQFELPALRAGIGQGARGGRGMMGEYATAHKRIELTAKNLSEIKRLNALVRELAGILRIFKWVAHPDLENEYVCPWCGGLRSNGHATNCPRQTVLAKAAKALGDNELTKEQKKEKI